MSQQMVLDIIRSDPLSLTPSGTGRTYDVKLPQHLYGVTGVYIEGYSIIGAENIDTTDVPKQPYIIVKFGTSLQRNSDLVLAKADERAGQNPIGEATGGVPLMLDRASLTTRTFDEPSTRPWFVCEDNKGIDLPSLKVELEGPNHELAKCVRVVLYLRFTTNLTVPRRNGLRVIESGATSENPSQWKHPVVGFYGHNF